MIQGLVSIIIPIYKAEKYLSQCVESVLRQTYTNLQVILVDDGSPDTCGKICDSYACRDARVQVIHKANGGLSDARNAGLPLVMGEFVYYLDSDDYIEQNTIELMVAEQRKSGADIVLANYYYTYSNHEDTAITAFHKGDVLDNVTAMEALVEGKIETFAWGKLLRAEIAKKYLFPKDKRFEDHYWTHYVFGDAEKVAILPQLLIHYRQRDDSISFTYDLKRLDMLEGWMNRKVFLEQRYPELLEICYKRYAERYVGLAWLILTRMKKNKHMAFQKLRTVNAVFHLQNYSEGKRKKLICALDSGDIPYVIRALAYRIMRL